MKRFLILIIITVLFISGCKKAKKAFVERILKPKEKPKPMEVELAEALLRPSPQRFTVSKDPFRPLTEKSYVVSQEELDLLMEVEKDIVFVGAVVSQDGSFALLKFPPEKIYLVRVGDKVGKYKVKVIELSRIILEDEERNKLLELKKGEEK